MLNSAISQELMQTRKLPIEAMLIAQQSVLLPLYFFVPIWIALLNTAAALLVLYSTRRSLAISRWLKVAITILAIGGVLIVFKQFTGKDAGIALITAMYGLKILEVKAVRDANLLLSFGFFMLVTAFLFSQSPIIAVYQFVPILLILNGFLILQSVDNQALFKKNFANVLKELSGYLLLAIPVMIILFIFFPRFSGPIWRMPGSSSSVSGISDSMSPGEISGLQLLDEVAFRVKFEKEMPQESDFYWRVLTLDEFDGISWTRAETRELTNKEPISDDVEIYQYSITLEPTQQDYLVTLDRPVTIPKRGELKKDYTTRTRYRVVDRMRYSIESAPGLIIDQTLTDLQKRFYTQIPSSGNERSRQWAQEQRQMNESDWSYIHQLLLQINQQPYFYTLQPPIMDEDTVDSFWFDKRSGFCEHYAGALVYLARAAGIPARVVIGYQGGDKNTLTDYWIVRYANAHAWTEVWIQDKGWIRVDPTSAIASTRVEQSLLNEYRQRESLFDAFDVVELDDISWFKQFDYWADQMNSNWNEWILDYNSQRQRQLFANWGISSITNRQLIIGMLIGVFVFIGFVGVRTLRQRSILKPLARSYIKVQQKLSQKKVVDYDVSMGPQQLKQLLQTKDAIFYQPIIAVLEDYIQLQYVQQEPSLQATNRLLRRFRQLKI
ncbi:transglutaminase family protein [Aliikangiella sp. IMCC44359]|uniref:transglutaminase family protein n=1 Tax=Aliikangiella sp. IMCC44359 TaxID=3459125 RepID=UPI00403B138D